jgi:hypothetical protein
VNGPAAELEAVRVRSICALLHLTGWRLRLVAAVLAAVGAL